MSATDGLLSCPTTQQAFLCLLTTAAVLRPYGNAPLSNRQAWRAYRALVADDRVALRVEEPPGLERLWVGFGGRDSASPKLWMDACPAAFALAARCRRVTTDSAFGQFPGLDPLVLG